ncbi:endonuclease [Allokutzneria multivorans]|uniref:endonuclease n=1 Tax=Allokutzneria multivorans TaxID=1142134 RepID=UPI0031E8181F
MLVQGPTTASAATPLTVAQAMGQQNGSSATVRGYVVGQPTAASTVLRSNFTGDTAIALADTAGETATSRMLYVQITSSFRAAYGLRSTPSLLGKRLDVTGKLGPYFSHAGLTSPTAIAPSGPTTPTTTPPPTTPPPTTSPPPVGADDYYKDAIGKTGPALKTALHTIIKTNTKLSYDQVWEALKVTDEDPNNSANVMLFYENRSLSKAASGGNPDNWNREHVWAKSHGNFGTATGPGTDIHHLRPTDVSVNSTRGNKDFDMGGSPVSEAPGNRTDEDSWEPADHAKGDVARMIFYMAVRYAGGDGFPDLEVNDTVNNGTNPFMGKLSVLKQWSEQDKPDAFEKKRNQLIFDRFQHNRNPFIDHPEWVSLIWP